MTVYLLTIFSSSVLALMADKNQRGCLFYGRKQLPSLVTIILIVFSTIPAILTAGFRYGIGVDYTPIYEATFYTVLSGGTQIEYSPVALDHGFLLLIKLIQVWFDSPVALFFITAAIIYLCTFLFIKRESSNCFYGVLCFFLSGLYFSSLNIVRQFLAVSIGYLLFSVAESHKRKNFCWLWYGFSILLLSQIHLSALLILFLPFLKNIRFNRKKTVIFLGALCVAIPVVRNVMYLFLRHTRYSYYLSSNIQLMDLDFSGLVYALMLSSLALYYLPQIQKEHNGLLYYNVLLIYDFAMLSSAFIPLVNRIALYFKFPTVIVLLPMILEQARKQKKYLLIVGILLFMLLSTGYLYFVHGLSGIYPYQSIFE